MTRPCRDARRPPRRSTDDPREARAMTQSMTNRGEHDGARWRRTWLRPIGRQVTVQLGFPEDCRNDVDFGSGAAHRVKARSEVERLFPRCARLGRFRKAKSED